MAAGQQLEANIVATVATAEAVLSHFERSLLEAGFADGAEPYRQLSETLIGQRLWAESSGTATSARFAAVGARARAIHALLLPYVEAFGRLTVLAAPSLLDDDDSGPPAARADAEADPLDAAVLAALDTAGRPLSMTALRAELGVPRAELLAAVERLAAAGSVRRRTASGRELVSREAG